MSRRRRRSPDLFDGLLLTNKPAGCTSHDVVARIRSHFHLSKVGHGGTLDPLATGLLVILIGRATKFSAQVTGGDKTYAGSILLGLSTSTQDTAGKILAKRDTVGITSAQVAIGMKGFLGDIEQIPPMVSAVKKDGIPLYKLARKGREIEREPRPVRIHRFDLLDFNNPVITFEVESSKGTYVRTLAHDLGEQLGVGACLSSLRRTASGPFRLDDAHTFESILEETRETLGERMLSLDALNL